MTVLALALPATAVADPAPGVCEHDPATETVTYQFPETRERQIPVIQRAGNASQQILVGRGDTADCGEATISNTKLIRIVGSPPGSTDDTDLGIALDNGDLFTDEGGGETEEIPVRVEDPGRVIKIRVDGSPRDDHIVGGTLGVNLNADEAADDLDVTVTGGHALALVTVGCGSPNCGPADPGTAGADRLSVAGGEGTGGPVVTGFNRWPRLFGGEGDDHLTGDVSATVTGGPGDDTLVGAAAVEQGDVTRAGYGAAPAAVTVDLAAGTATGTGTGTDTLIGIGGILGSRHADTLRGSDGENTINGGFGAFDGEEDAGDLIEGRGGEDWLDGYGGDDEIDGGDGPDVIFAHTGDDVLRGGEGDDSLYGDGGSSDDPEGDDRLEGGPGDDGLLPYGGDDIVIGGPGARDRINFFGAEAGVTLDLGITTPQDTGGAGVETVSETEGVSGTEFTDRLLGDDGRNTLSGGQGFGASQPPNEDVLVGRGGDDLLLLNGEQGGGTADGGEGDDDLFGDEGPDTLDGGPGEDFLDAKGGDDTLRGPADRALDKLLCGAGTDDALYDGGLDELTECELGGPGTPPPDPPPADLPPPAPPAVVPPAAVPLAPPASPPAPVLKDLPASLIVAPKSSRRCASRRKFKIRLKAPGGGIQYESARITLKRGKKTVGRRITARRSEGRMTATVDLTRLPRGKYTVKIVARTTDGRVLEGTRKYRTCAKRRKGKKIRV